MSTDSDQTTATALQSVLDGRWAHVRAEALRVPVGATWALVPGEDAEAVDPRAEPTSTARCGSRSSPGSSGAPTRQRVRCSNRVRPLRAEHHRGRRELVPPRTAGSPRPAPRPGRHRRGDGLGGELRLHNRVLVDAFAIPQEWMVCAILDQEATRQDATFAEDQRPAERRGAQETVTKLVIVPAQ